MGCNYKNDRMRSIRFQGQALNVTVTQVYAPTTDAEENIVDQFYEDLLVLPRSTPKTDDIFIVGDWNAKVRNHTVDGVTGKFGVSKTNEAGQRFLKNC